MLSAVRSRGIRMNETTRTGASATRMLSRVTFEEMAVNADAEQLKLMEEQIVQVDEQDEIVGPISKKDAHIYNGVLHRAFSVFVFNARNELLIQKRAREKITFPGFWANTCCSHPLFTEGELDDGVGVKRAAIRKLEHELGISASTFSTDDLAYVSTIMYKAESDANWTEYEMDHILFARGELSLDNVNSNEVEQVEWIARENLPALLGDSTRKLSPWFRLICSKLLPRLWDDLNTVLEKDNTDRQIHDYR
ncbi:unnamed protein product [Hyaloperonospora brassicae]|uniref:isopentenyl-diphosphate Delta-isomerase n=1 Tax=Hyaloperonospora brassicae TaxID=162125 RepID=A0AAV0TP37_HYABA|nr:unnamed protein product [Hyaloperonospora brassicae]